MREIKFEVGKHYNYDYGNGNNLIVLCLTKDEESALFALVSIEGNFNSSQTPYAMTNISKLMHHELFNIRSSINFDNEGSYKYEYVALEDGMLCATEEALFIDKCEL